MQYPSHNPVNKRKLLGKYSIIENNGDTYLATATPPLPKAFFYHKEGKIKR